MLITEILTGKRLNLENTDPRLEPTDEEIRGIRLDKQLKRRPKARNYTFTAMPGNQSAYPAL